MSSEEREVYEKKVLDKLVDLLLDNLTHAIDRVRPGWKVRNEARVEEFKLTLYALNRSPPGLLGLSLVSFFILIALIGPYIAPFSYDMPLVLCDRNAYLAPPGTIITVKEGSLCSEVYGIKPGNYTLILGADDYGRDLFSRILYGARTSFVVAVLVMAIGPLIGITLGLISGYRGGSVDETIMRITDVFIAFPGLILAIAFSAVLPGRVSEILDMFPPLASATLSLFALKPEHVGALANLVSVIIALWIVWWPGYTRIVRGMVLSARENVYVEAARAIGVPTHSILFRHILPNILGPILVFLTLDFGGVILVEAGLSFLGLGAVPPIADWGRIVYDGAEYFPRAWWLVFFPGLATLLAVLGFNLIGDSLRDVLDPKTRRRIEFRVKGKR
ncbi:MAG: ABC transporter permease [Thermoprotei archaeon]|nr:ABC transporter permease [Thermoprotei archaeon]